MPLLRRRHADGMDHRIALFERVAARHRQRRAVPFGERFGGGLEIGGAAIRCGGVDEIADDSGGVGEAQRLVAPRRVGGQQDARAGVVGLAVAVEAVLAEQPAQGAGALVAGDAIGAGGEGAAHRREAPW